jgi:hypothetical protein
MHRARRERTPQHWFTQVEEYVAHLCCRVGKVQRHWLPILRNAPHM